MPKSTQTLSVIIPFYNEEKTLPIIINRVLKRKEVFEIILVDDGSTDNSYQTIKNIKDSRVNIIRLKTNQGKGAAIRNGLKKARGKWVIFQDADLEISPKNYPKLLSPLINSQADFAIGTRWKNNNGRFLFKAGNIFLTTLLNIMFNSNFQDSYCGYKVTTKKIWDSLKLASKRFEIEAEITAKIARKKLRIAQIDIDYKPRTYKQGKKIKAIDLYKGIKTLFQVRFSSFS